MTNKDLIKDRNWFQDHLVAFYGFFIVKKLLEAKFSSENQENRPDEFFQSNIFYFLVHPSEATLDDSNEPTGRPRPGWPTMDNKMLED